MADLQKLNQTKERILSVLRANGPSFPAKISRETGVSPLFTAAILSEMVAEKRLTVSAMKVGSSPIYILPGQEAQLEHFSSYLNHKEREAFDLIKTGQVLDDEAQDPAIRVALRKLKDFAHPVVVRNDDQEKLFWKYFLATDETVRSKVETVLDIPPMKAPQKVHVEPIEEREKMTVPRSKKESPDQTVTEALIPEVATAPEPIKAAPKAQKSKKESQFALKLKDYLLGKEIELLQELLVKPREFAGKVRIDTPFGKQEFYLIAKDKKKITEDELIIAVQRAQAEKMPALIMAPGEPDKLAAQYLKEWRNLIKFEKVKF